MKLPLASVLLALVWRGSSSPGPAPELRFFPFLRTIEVSPGNASQACAVLDPKVFAHASPTLADLRVYQIQPPATPIELPYAITISESTLLPPDPARILNLGMSGTHITFDVQMPARSYTELKLHLGASNFIASARLSGLRSPGDRHPTSLGDFTLFDLSSQHLSRSTLISLQESSFPFLHVDLEANPAPGSVFVASPAMIQGAEVPPTREAQTLYTTVAHTDRLEQRRGETVANIEVPAQVPVERVTFALPSGYSSNFNRMVRIRATHTAEEDASPGPPEEFSGEVSRVRLAPPHVAPGTLLDERSLSIPAVLAFHAEHPASVEIVIENGDDRTVPFTSVSLEMRQRKLCFSPPAALGLIQLFYGDSALAAPLYDFGRLLDIAAPTRPARLAPEQRNPDFTPRPVARRSLSERHPEFFWLVLLGVIAILAVIAFRSARHIHPDR